MKNRLIACLLLFGLAACGADNDAEPPASYERLDGFIDLYWDEDGGRLLIAVESIDEPFIYQSSLPRGVGSNDLGLDRGQLGQTRLVRFVKSGPRVLLVQDNLDYRAMSADTDERQAVSESFARSVVWGFDVVEERDGALLVDGTDFFVRDSHWLSARLQGQGEGSYSPDRSRSAIYMPRTKAFPDNTEVEAIVTFTGYPTGPHLPTVVPDSSSVTVHTHHSFIRLPEDGYEPIAYDPRAGVIGLGYGDRGFIDYASPIGEDMFVNFGRRHRLEKVDPSAEVSEAVEPIVYYVDRGAPEPVRSALIEGALWWNEAFEAAGYENAFQVELMPEGADPMDVRYNVIQWVHRSTRGWSYGSSVLDPRTGEILKGHVTLGSLRVRQDYMIAEGLLAPYTGESIPEEMLEMSLARIRQLSAHEVGHTIGFEHNFAASTQDRSSVMDYPFPLVRFDSNGELDLSDAYGVGIGEWDKRTVIYAYQDFPDDVDAEAGRQAILAETRALGFRYVTDADSRSVGAAHPYGNLWDNGEDSVAELEHLLAVRAHALGRFSENNIRLGRPDATLEEVLVPIYLLHRFQIHAVGKLIGGSYYDYTMRGAGQEAPSPVDGARQRQAIEALIATLDSDVLRLPDGLTESIPPRPPGFPATRETFTDSVGIGFDPLAPAASSTKLTLEVLLHPHRAARMNRQSSPRFAELVDRLLGATWFKDGGRAYDAIERQTNLLVLDGLMRLAMNESADESVRATAFAAVQRINGEVQRMSGSDRDTSAFLRFTAYRIEQVLEDPSLLDSSPTVTVPPGSPIGSGEVEVW
ncbi:MAG: zinc-dependent metalloprotease [Woeseiaceae bacterium]|nr:zinc-dependent metalloprotease [Woeseiaceae bacterium]